MSPEDNRRLTSFALPLSLVARETAQTDPHLRPLGTGWLLDLYGSLLLVSAKHVLEDVFRPRQIDELVVARGTGRGERPVAARGMLYLSSEREDVGYLLLDAPTVARLRDFPRVSYSELSSEPDSELELRAVVGWPQERRPPAHFVVENGTKKYPAEAITLSGETFAHEVGITGGFLGLLVDLNREGNERCPRDFKGISGAAIWAFRRGRWSVVGIQTDVIPRSNRRYIKGTCIRSLVKLIEGRLLLSNHGVTL